MVSSLGSVTGPVDQHYVTLETLVSYHQITGLETVKQNTKLRVKNYCFMSKTVDQKQYTGILKNQIVVGLSLCTWLKEKSRILLLSVILIGRIFQSYSGLVI